VPGRLPPHGCAAPWLGGGVPAAAPPRVARPVLLSHHHAHHAPVRRFLTQYASAAPQAVQAPAAPATAASASGGLLMVQPWPRAGAVTAAGTVSGSFSDLWAPVIGVVPGVPRLVGAPWAAEAARNGSPMLARPRLSYDPWARLFIEPDLTDAKVRGWLAQIRDASADPAVGAAPEPREWDDGQISKLVQFAQECHIEHLPAEEIYRRYVLHTVEVAENG